MSWTDTGAGAAEKELDSAWEALNKVIHCSGMSLWVQHAITACVRDTVTFAGILRDQHEMLVNDFESGAAQTRGMSPAELMEDWKHRSGVSMRAAHRYAGALRAIYFFVRALQDAAYRGFVELDGSRTGESKSMQACANKPGSHIHKEIAAAIPEYFSWFAKHRYVRNRMKLGVGVGAQFEPSAATRRLLVNLHRVTERPPKSTIDRQLALEDAEECLQKSAMLLRVLRGEIIAIHPEDAGGRAG